MQQNGFTRSHSFTESHCTIQSQSFSSMKKAGGHSTVLEAAVQSGHLDIVLLLCAGKADPNLYTAARPAVVDPLTATATPAGYVARKKPSPLLQSMLQAREDITAALRRYGAVPDLGSSVVSCALHIEGGPEVDDFDASWFRKQLRDSVCGIPSLQVHLVLKEGSVQVMMTLSGAPVSAVKERLTEAVEGTTILDGLRDKFPQFPNLKVEVLQPPSVVPAGHCDSAFANAVGLSSPTDRLRVCKLCLDAGADVNSNLSRGMRPLQRAMAAGDTDLVDEFLRRGASPLLPTAPGSLGSQYSSNPLLASAFIGDFDMFRTLYTTIVDSGTKEQLDHLLNTPNTDGDTPSSILRSVHGVDMQALISKSESVLPLPIDQPTVESLVATLGERGQYTFARQELGRILDELFHLNRIYGPRYDAFLSLEIQRGASQSKRGPAVTAPGARPSSSRGRPSTAGQPSRQEFNKSLHLSHVLSQAPRYRVLGQMDFERQRLLLEPRLLEVCTGTDMKLVENMVVAKKVNVNCRGAAEYQGVQLVAATPLAVASLCGHDRVVAQLLGLKADPNAAGGPAGSESGLTHDAESRESPLWLAVTYGNANVVKILVMAKAEVSAEGNEGMRLLRTLAEGRRYAKGCQAVQALVKATLRCVCMCECVHACFAWVQMCVHV